MASLKEHALALAGRGFAVFPIWPGQKTPRYRGSFHDATTDRAQIETWWTDNPDANIGIYPAACTPPMLVVDQDERDTESGKVTWAALLEEHGGAEPLLISGTPSGGLHLWFPLLEGAKIQSSTRRLGAGLDVRSWGGYVLAPPSILLKDGKRIKYKWIEPPSDKEILLAPTWLLDAAGTAPERHPDADKLAEGIKDWDEKRNLQRAAGWLKRMVKAGHVAIAFHGGNDKTYAMAAGVRDFAISEHECLDLMAKLWNPYCKPPWSDGEIGQTIGNAYEYANRPAGNFVAAKDADILAVILEAIKPVVSSETPKSVTQEGDIPADKWFYDRPEMVKLKAPGWLIEGTIPEKAIVIVYGGWGVYKTFLVLDLLLHLALGHTWAGRAIAKAFRVAYVAGEGRYGIRQRVEAWEAHYETGQVMNFRFGHTMPTFREAEILREWLGALTKKNWPNILAIDTVSHAMRGQDENSAQDTSEFMALLMEIRDKIGCTIICVQHPGKDADKGVRGSGVFEQKADVILRVTNPDTGTVMVEMLKQKDAERWKKPIGFKVLEAHGSVVLKYGENVAPLSDRADDNRVTIAKGFLMDLPDDAKPVSALDLARAVVSRTLEKETTVNSWFRKWSLSRADFKVWVYSRTPTGEAASFKKPVKNDDNSRKTDTETLDI